MATTKEPAAAPEPIEPMGYSFETQADPRREAVEAAARRDHLARQNPDEYVRMANGNVVRVQPGVAPSYRIVSEEADMLGHPGGEWYIDKDDNRLRMHRGTTMLLDTKPPFYDKYGQFIGPRYAWRVHNSLDPKDSRPAITRNLHQGGRIRYVERGEVDKNCEFAVYTPVPAGETAYVGYFSQILCEILDPRLAYEMHKRGEDRALDRSRNASRDIAQSPSLGEGLVTAIPGKGGMNLSVSDTRQGG
jgi:hypothetical protein